MVDSKPGAPRAGEALQLACQSVSSREDVTAAGGYHASYLPTEEFVEVKRMPCGIKKLALTAVAIATAVAFAIGVSVVVVSVVGTKQVDGSAGSSFIDPRTPEGLDGIMLVSDTVDDGSDDSLKITAEQSKHMPGSKRDKDPSAARPLRIHLDFSMIGTGDSDDGSTQRIRDLIRYEVMPRAAAEYGKLLNVRIPVVGPLYLTVWCTRWETIDGAEYCQSYNRDEAQPGHCFRPDGVWHPADYLPPRTLCVDDSCVDLPGGTGARDADVVIYVIADDAVCRGGLARASACHYDYDTGRPTFGFISFCPSLIARRPQFEDTSLLVRAAMHEMGHALFFGANFFNSRYIHDDGSAVSREEMYGTDPHNGHRSLRPPRLLQAIANVSDCPNPDPLGIPLEESTLPPGSYPSHWDMSHMKGDMMNPMLHPTGRVLFSYFDMAVAESSGWYYGSWDNVAHTLHGYKAGCDFFSSNCTEYMAAHPDQRFYCPDEKKGEMMCTHERRFYGNCGHGSSYHPGCNVLFEESKVQVEGAWYPTNCYDPTNAAANGWKGHFFGAHSRCMETVGSVSTPDGLSNTDPLCVKMSCTQRGRLRLEIEGVQLDCPSGENVDVSGVTGWSGTLGPCPDNALVCSTLGCPSDCNGNGDCVEGECKCFPGYVGPECENEVCYESPTSGCRGKCVLGTGICID